MLAKSENLDIDVTESAVPMIVTPRDIGINLHKWFSENSILLSSMLAENGALLFRGFKVNGAKHFQKLLESGKSDVLEYKNRSTPRRVVSGKVYTSTEYPQDESIPLHNENSYTNSWAERLFFFCLKAAEQGGETPIANSARVHNRIPKHIVEKFSRKKIMYVRNYGHLDLPWQEVFQTDSKDEVESFCINSGITFEWIEDNRLKTKQVCQAIIDHPKTGEPIWFNQAHLFHYTSLSPELRTTLLDSVGEGGLPRNTYYGDGESIETEALDIIRSVYEEEKRVFTWRSGDVLLLDNMMYAHGRNPFSGSRKVLVGMTGSVHAENL